MKGDTAQGHSNDGNAGGPLTRAHSISGNTSGVAAAVEAADTSAESVVASAGREAVYRHTLDECERMFIPL